MNFRTVHRRTAGFTLVELIIAIAIAGILAAVAVPAFNSAMRKSHRSDAISALTAAQQAQERWRTNHDTYAGSMATLGLPAASNSGYYGVAISGSSATGYTVTATAVSGGTQSQDTNCSLLAVEMNGGNLRYGGGTSTADWADPNRCWAK